MRHADVSANAVGVFFGLGVSLILETVSIFYNGPWFWAFFCTVSIYIEEFSFFKDQFGFVKALFTELDSDLKFIYLKMPRKVDVITLSILTLFLMSVHILTREHVSHSPISTLKAKYTRQK